MLGGTHKEMKIQGIRNLREPFPSSEKRMEFDTTALRIESFDSIFGDNTSKAYNCHSFAM